MVGRMQEWGKVGRSNPSSVPFFPFYCMVGEERQGEETALIYQTIPVPGDGGCPLDDILKHRCAEECSESIAHVILIIL